MATEAQKEASSKARAPKKAVKVESPAKPGDQGHAHSISDITWDSNPYESQDQASLHREVASAAEAIYHGRKLFINVVLAPVANDSTVVTDFGGIPVRPSVRKELVLSNGEIVGF